MERGKARSAARSGRSSVSHPSPQPLAPSPLPYGRVGSGTPVGAESMGSGTVGRGAFAPVAAGTSPTTKSIAAAPRPRTQSRARTQRDGRRGSAGATRAVSAAATSPRELALSGRVAVAGRRVADFWRAAEDFAARALAAFASRAFAAFASRPRAARALAARALLASPAGGRSLVVVRGAGALAVAVG